jgi:hypothetical protein
MTMITIQREELKRDVCNVVIPKGRKHGEMLYLPNENYLEMVLNQETGVWEFPGEKVIH